MKNLKNMSLMTALITVFTLSFTACGNDDEQPAKPVINLTEIGHDNSKHVHPGQDLHLEGDIVAQGLIKRIDIEIHQEEGGSYKIKQSFTEGKYVGVRNVEFHEHIDIPANAPIGEYHMHFTVTDQCGQQTTVESHLEIIEGNGDEHDHHDE